MPCISVCYDPNRTGKSVKSAPSSPSLEGGFQYSDGKFSASMGGSACIPRDSVWNEADGYVACLEGVVLNKESLDCLEWARLAGERMREDLRGFLSGLRGLFRGFLYDKRSSSLSVFTDHVSSRPLYSFHTYSVLYVNTSLERLAQQLRAARHPVTLSEFGAYCMIGYGFMLDSHTLVDGVEKIPNGSILTFDKRGRTTLERYWKGFEPRARSSGEIGGYEDSIAEFICIFDDAVKDEFWKDKEYDRSHIATLSGGLDSRTNVFFAKRNGIEQLIALCYSQSGYLEEKLARQVAFDCEYGFRFISLDGGKYFNELDRAVRDTEGMTTCRPIAHSLHAFSMIDWSKYGLLHTGLLGDSIVGALHYDESRDRERPTTHVDIALVLNPKNSEVLSDQSDRRGHDYFRRIEDWISPGDAYCGDAEMFILRNRGLNGILQSNLGARSFCDVISPFLHVDVLDFMLSLPREVRANYKFYIDFMARSIPRALDFRWELTGLKPRLGGVVLGPRHAAVRFIKQLKGIFFSWRPEPSRHPYKYWLRREPFLSKTIRDYFTEHRDIVSGNPTLAKDVDAAMEWGNFCVKLRVLTLLGACKHLGLGV